MNLCSLGALSLLTQVFQDAQGLSPLAAGLLLLPAMLPLPLLGTTVGRLTGRFGALRTADDRRRGRVHGGRGVLPGLPARPAPRGPR